jgi:pimeloyl-ACP methyl ester carboxylesterase
MKRFVETLLIVSLLAASCRAGIQAQAGRGMTPAAAPPRPFLRPCPMPELRAKAWCGKYEVFEDRAAKRGRKIALNMVIMPAIGEQSAPDPVFFIAGGPGQGAATLAADLGEGPLMNLRQERAIVFLDQRGTGASNPLTCHLYTDDTDLRGYFEDMFPVQQVRTCRAQLEQVADLTQYTTTNAIDDLDKVRRALGYEQINLYGGSYGTTVALAYIRQYGAHVRSAVLAGVAPTNMGLPLPFARGAQYALTHLIDDCATDTACRAAFPNLPAEFRSVLDRLGQGPVRVEVVNQFTKKLERFSLSRGIFAERLRMMLYGRAPASVVPLLIHRAAQGDFKPFILAALPQARGIYQSLSLGMYFSVTCAESVPFITEADVRRETGNTFLGDWRVRVHQRACREWVRAAVPSNFISPVKSDVPVLMLSGEVDPASPRWLGAEVARHLPHSRQVIIPHGGHDYLSPCLSTIIAEFIAKGSGTSLNTSCAETTRRPPFVTTLPEALTPVP